MLGIATLIVLLLALQPASAQEVPLPRMAFHALWDEAFHLRPANTPVPADFMRASGPDGTRYAISRAPHFSGQVFDRAAVCRDVRLGNYAIAVRLTPAAGDWFADFSRANVAKGLAIVLNGRVLSAPFVREPILGGRLQLSIFADANEAYFLEAVLLGRERLDDRSRSQFKKRTLPAPPPCSTDGLLGEPEDASNLRALEYLTKAIAKNSNDAGAYALRGNLLCHRKQHKEGIADHTRALALTPADKEILFARGRCHLDIAAYNDAIADFDAAVAAGYDRAYVAEQRSDAYSRMGRHQDAITDLNFLIDKLPGQPTYHFERAFNYAGIDRHDLSVLDYQHAIDLGDKSADVFNNKAWSHFRLQEFDIGLREVNRAIEIDPTFANAFSTRAHIAEALGDKTKAIADYEKALSLDATLADAGAALVRLRGH